MPAATSGAGVSAARVSAATSAAGISATEISPAALATSSSLATSAATALDYFGWFEAVAVFFDKVFAMIGMVEIARDGGFDGFFDFPEEFDFVFGAHGDGEAGFSGSPGAADAVDVGFGFVGEVVVDDEAYVFDVDSAGGDISGNEDGDAAGFECFEGFFTLILGFISVDGTGFVAGGGESLDEFVCSVFGAVEDNGEAGGLGRGLFFDKVCQK